MTSAFFPAYYVTFACKRSNRWRLTEVEEKARGYNYSGVKGRYERSRKRVRWMQMVWKGINVRLLEVRQGRRGDEEGQEGSEKRKRRGQGKKGGRGEAKGGEGKRWSVWASALF